jgi:hypothetical protein
MRARLSSLLVMTGGLCALGCQAMNTPLYFKSGNDPLVISGMMDGERVKDALALVFRRPNMQEQKDLDARRAAGADSTPPVKVPWISRSNVHVEVLFTVTNLDAKKDGVFNFMVDGANEFLKYDEDVVSAVISAPNEPPVYLPLMSSRPQMLAPGGVYQGTVREDDFAEAESDLNAIDQFMAPFAGVLINRSELNPPGVVNVPPGVNVDIPALVEVDVTFTANVAMRAEWVVRVRDDGDQLLHETGDRQFAIKPVVFQPPPPAMP